MGATASSWSGRPGAGTQRRGVDPLVRDAAANATAGNVCPPPALWDAGLGGQCIGGRRPSRRRHRDARVRKSTFSKALSTRTGLSLIHLDLHYWKPGWVRPSDDEWRVKQRSLLAGDAWIADGNYHETLDLRLERADTVVVLATPWWLCACRAFVAEFEGQLAR